MAPAAGAAEPLKVAGIHASPVENAWNSVIHQALLEAAEEGTIEYVFSESVSGTDYPRAMREYAEQGVDLIIGESYAVESEAREVAADYPDTPFVMGSSGGPSGDNFGVFGTWNQDGAYLAGMLAGALEIGLREENLLWLFGGAIVSLIASLVAFLFELLVCARTMLRQLRMDRMHRWLE